MRIKNFFYPWWAGALSLLMLSNILLTPHTARAISEATGNTELNDFLQETFQDFLYHGVYVDEDSNFLVISLKINPGNLAKKMQKTKQNIDEILAQTLIQDLYEQRFSYYLFGAPDIEGVSIVLTWEGCQRIKKWRGKEIVLLKEGRSEFDRFDVSRNLFFDKLSMVQQASDPFSSGKLFDSIDFSHIKGESYKGTPFHKIVNNP